MRRFVEERRPCFQLVGDRTSKDKRLSRNVWRGWMAGARCDSGRLSKPVWTASCGPRPPVGGIAASTCVTQAM